MVAGWKVIRRWAAPRRAYLHTERISALKPPLIQTEVVRRLRKSRVDEEALSRVPREVGGSGQGRWVGASRALKDVVGKPDVPHHVIARSESTGEPPARAAASGTRHTRRMGVAVAHAPPRAVALQPSSPQLLQTQPDSHGPDAASPS